jgi:CheY-like chemotaxis protein
MPRDKATSSSRLLVADDNYQNCELLDAYLSEAGYQVDMAYDGQQTLDSVARAQPDLILLDIMMPKVSGYEVCQRLKSDPQTRKIPILMVTALAEMGDIEKAVNAGADDFLTKPVNKLELTTRVKSLLQIRHLTNERDRLLAYLEGVDGARDDHARSALARDENG